MNKYQFNTAITTKTVDGSSDIQAQSVVFVNKGDEVITLGMFGDNIELESGDSLSIDAGNEGTIDQEFTYAFAGGGKPKLKIITSGRLSYV
jgi:hypothetical protein